jgi:hypothetical protein
VIGSGKPDAESMPGYRFWATLGNGLWLSCGVEAEHPRVRPLSALPYGPPDD